MKPVFTKNANSVVSGDVFIIRRDLSGVIGDVFVIRKDLSGIRKDLPEINGHLSKSERASLRRERAKVVDINDFRSK